MSEKGWIVKETDYGDKRMLRIYLSERAKNLHDQLAREREEANEEILRELSIEESLLLKRLLKDLR